MTDHLAPFRKYAIGLQEDLDTVEGDTLMVSKGELRGLLEIAKNVERICRHAQGDFVCRSTKLLNALANAGIQDKLDRRAELERQRDFILSEIKHLEDDPDDIDENEWEALDEAHNRLKAVMEELGRIGTPGETPTTAPKAPDNAP